MDRIERYKELVREAICQIAAEVPTEEDIRREMICDDELGHYELLEVGWHGPRRVHGIIAHCDVRDDKVHVEHDGTSFGIVDFLLANGVSADHIVIGFHAPDLRKFTEFAAA
jgi:ketopantoate reductase